MTTKVVYNTSIGEFSISREALTRMQELGYTGDAGIHNDCVYLYDYARHNPILVQVVEELGPKANSRHGCLRIAEVSGPYRIEEYDGWETVMEPDDYEWVTP
jgi:hypothetical protein